MQQVLIAVNDFTERHINQINSQVQGWAEVLRIDENTDIREYNRAMKQSDIVMGWPNAEGLVDSSIRFCQLCSAGYDPYLAVPLDKKKDFTLCNARGVFSVPAAEQTLAMMFALSRRLNLHIRDQQQHHWQRASEYRIIDGNTICVVGLGAIGTAIAERCSAIGMSVTGVTRTGKEPLSQSVSRIVGFDNLADVLPECDHVALSLPANSQTQGMFNEQMFRRMKADSCFYNVGRGSLVVEQDLVTVLKDGHLFGAGLDVFHNEPLPSDHPFWDMPNVIVLPHTAGRYVQEFDRLCDLFTENLERYRTGKPLQNIIDLNKRV